MDSGGHSGRTAAIVFNPVKIGRQRLEQAYAKAAEGAGWGDPLWFETTIDDPGSGVAGEAVAAGATLVIAAGGDGTVRAVASALLDSTVALGLLPVGTGNLLARNLHLPLGVEASIRAALTGVDRRIDVGIVDIIRRRGVKAEQEIFLVMAGLGLDAAMIAETRPELKKRMGWLAYVDGGLRAARSSRRISLRYSLDGGEERHLSAHSLLVGNCGLLPANILLLPEAEIDDGILDIVALRPKGFFGWVHVGVKIVWENGVMRRSQAGRKMMGPTKEVRTLLYLKGTTLSVRSEKAVPFEIDGEEAGRALKISTRLDPLSLTVRVGA